MAGLLRNHFNGGPRMDNDNLTSERSELIVIGNGFDMKCNLKSHYSDYLNHRAKENSSFYQTFTENMKMIYSFEDNGHDPYPNVNIINFVSYYHDIDINRINIWEMLFSVECFDHETQTIKWSDIERVIKDYLVVKSIGCKASELHVIIQEALRAGFLDWSSIKERRKLQLVAVIEIEILKRTQQSTLIKSLTVKSRSDIAISRNEDTFFSYLFDELRKFENDFRVYLTNEVNRIRLEYLRNSNRLLNRISNNNSSSIYLINFNFTNPFSALKVNNVHGSLLDNEQDLIFGIDTSRNSDGKNDIEFDRHAFRFSKTFRKLSQNQDNIIFELPSRTSLKKITFYGHSLGEGDYAYFQTFFDYYDLYSSDLVIEFKYSKYLDKTMDEVRFEEQEKVFKLLDFYGATMLNKNWGRNLTHKLLLEKRLSIKYLGFNPSKNDSSIISN
jgi:hypothetical protein